MDIKGIRTLLKLSQDELAKLSKVRRVNILSAEKGYRKLTPKEFGRVKVALALETDRVVKRAKRARNVLMFGGRDPSKKRARLKALKLGQRPVKTKATKAA